MSEIQPFPGYSSHVGFKRSVASRDRQVGTALTSLASTIWARSQAPGASGFLGSWVKVGGCREKSPTRRNKILSAIPGTVDAPIRALLGVGGHP